MKSIFPTEKSYRDSEKIWRPWICLLCIYASISITVLINSQSSTAGWQTLSKYGYLPADEIWSGRYWALITSNFVHVSWMHLVFNCYWMWILGSALEENIGRLRFTVFVLGSAIISSCAELAVSDTTGIGLSGVVYAIFGFIWLSRYKRIELLSVIDDQRKNVFLIWLVLCFIFEATGTKHVANAAHVGGLLFGIVVAGVFVLRYRRPLPELGLVLMFLLSTVVLLYCPWSLTWLSMKAYAAHDAKRYGEAIRLYDKVIAKNPESSWAYTNRSHAYRSLGDFARADADLGKAKELDPEVGDDEPQRE